MYMYIWYMCVFLLEKTIHPSIVFDRNLNHTPVLDVFFHGPQLTELWPKVGWGQPVLLAFGVMMDARSARCWRGWGGRFWKDGSARFQQTHSSNGEDQRVKILWMGQRNPAPIRWFISLFVGFQPSKIGGWSDFAGPSTVCKLYTHNADHPVVHKLLDMFFHCKGKQLSCFFVPSRNQTWQ